MAPTSKLRRIQQTLTVSLHRWPAQKIDKNSTFHLDGHTIGFRPQNHLPRPPSTPTGYRVQRKSVLQLTIPASWSQYVLCQKSFQIAGRKFLMNRIDYGFSAFESPPPPHPKKNLQQPIGQVKNSIHQPDNKIHQTLAQYRTVVSLNTATIKMETAKLQWRILLVNLTMLQSTLTDPGFAVNALSD